MPELPEVETTKRGIAPYLLHSTLLSVRAFQPRLRYDIPKSALEALQGKVIIAVQRRAKYLILIFETGDCVVIHLGMSGSLRIETQTVLPRKHDHVIFEFSLRDQPEESAYLHFHDPRRFGFILAYAKFEDVPFFHKLAPEPLTDAFNAVYLLEALKKRKKPIKVAIMDQSLVVGVGNIYASEALFMAHINPYMTCTQLDLKMAEALVLQIKTVLQAAILQGGTSLKDFVNPQGETGYFAQTLQVYGRKNEACGICQSLITRAILGQRATYWCPKCQA